MTAVNIDKLKSFPIKNGEITSVEWIEKLENIMPNPLGLRLVSAERFYRLSFKLYPTEQSDIGVVLYLPEPKAWNGKFMGTGNGGSAGVVAEVSIINGISRGYAAANTDMGTKPNPDDCAGKPEVWVDFGHRATHLMTAVSKEIIEYFYGRAPRYSYFVGCSTGGQQGLSEAQRYPEDYDGIVCLSPAYDRVRLHSFFVWNWQQIHGKKNGAFNAGQAKAWQDAVVRAYGKSCKSSPQDLFLSYPGRIKGNPMDEPALQADIQSLLTNGQKEALSCIYDGPKNPVTGERIIAPFLPGTEAEGLSLVDISNKDSFAHDFFYLFRWILGQDFDFMEFDFDKDLQKTADKLSPILDAVNTDLSAFKKNGGKLLMVGGSADAIVPYKGLLDYYKKVTGKQGGLDETREFFRFFLMPGFGHTLGGPGVQEVGMIGFTQVPRTADHDVVCAIEKWVEQGIAPDRLLGTHFKGESLLNDFDYARPAYAYPYIAQFMGGDANDPENYRPLEDEQAY